MTLAEKIQELLDLTVVSGNREHNFVANNLLRRVLTFLSATSGALEITDSFVFDTANPSRLTFITGSLLIDATQTGTSHQRMVEFERIEISQKPGPSPRFEESFELKINPHKAPGDRQPVFNWTAQVPTTDHARRNPEELESLQKDFEEFKRLCAALTKCVSVD